MPAYESEINNQEICYIYEIYNNISEKIYIGSTKNINRRFKRHIKELKENKHHNVKLQRAWNHYGESAFKFKVIKSCNQEERWDLERCQVLLYDKKKVYNIADINKIPSRKGQFNSIEHRKKISLSNKGKKSWNKGGKNTWASKAGFSQVIKNKNIIKAINLNNNEIKYFLSSTSAAKYFNYKRKKISNILSGSSFKTREGWKFEWIEKTEENVLLSEGYFASI